MTVFPPAIEQYRVTASTPSRDLLTLGRFYSEAGGYASAILDKAHQSFARKCRKRYEKVVDMLIDREVIFAPKDLWTQPKGELDLSDLSSLTIDQLETQYLLCSSAHDSRSKAGRESFTYFHEGCIVKELSGRRASNTSDKIRIEYCKGLYRNELENLAFVIRKPETNQKDLNIFRANKDYTSGQLAALIKLYSRFNSVTEREILVQCVDKALDRIETSGRPDDQMSLVVELTDPACRSNIQIPEWIYPLIFEVMKRWIRMHHLPETEIIIPMLAYAMHTSEWEWQHKAGRIINRCYRNVLAFDADSSMLHKSIEELYISSICNEFVTRYKSSKLAAAWEAISETALDSCETISVAQYFKLMEVAVRTQKFANISEELEIRLKQKLEALASSGDIEAIAYTEFLTRKSSSCQ